MGLLSFHKKTRRKVGGANKIKGAPLGGKQDEGGVDDNPTSIRDSP